MTTREVIMDSKEPAYFDLETVALLREVLDDAWALLRPEQRATPTGGKQFVSGLDRSERKFECVCCDAKNVRVNPH